MLIPKEVKKSDSNFITTATETSASVLRQTVIYRSHQDGHSHGFVLYDSVTVEGRYDLGPGYMPVALKLHISKMKSSHGIFLTSLRCAGVIIILMRIFYF